MKVEIYAQNEYYILARIYSYRKKGTKDWFVLWQGTLRMVDGVEKKGCVKSTFKRLAKPKIYGQWVSDNIFDQTIWGMTGWFESPKIKE